ncbi:anthranilate synthase component II [Botrimarina hoheduenensis]|uniref:Aminodeoxychorismate synthase component 2 n=1 Tax=Botrimarina hoheduenensis TaxID=2528000 RepID=A0A5C5WGH4_9BACT|nr:aminodeoxychorismate/anthranilate synthase component II [Botrimarina hoheduenensis]TWT48882.1 Aminodeoxychorismate synthase component 2 [Botrimarina hoheduenensis]
MILVLDNYDSFVHNLARLVRLCGSETHVVRSDAIDVAGVRALGPAAIVISPGPGSPAEVGCSVEVVRQLAETTPILGVCLGHQAIVEAFGGKIVRAPEPMHGRTSILTHSGEGLFAGIPPGITVCRYHSLAADRPTLPAVLAITAESDDGVPMAIAHRRLPVHGVQFHPEAILTEYGQPMIENFIRIAQRNPSPPPQPGPTVPSNLNHPSI